MSRGYQFRDALGNHPTLDDVDREICEDTGSPYSKDNYCPTYEILIEAGFAMLMRWGGSWVTPAHVGLYSSVGIFPTESPERWTPLEPATQW